MLSKLSREPSELRWQPNLDKNKPEWHKFQFYARNQGICRIYGGIYEDGENSNVLPEFSRESRELP